MLFDMVLYNPGLILSNYTYTEAVFFSLLSYIIRGFEGFVAIEEGPQDFSSFRFSCADVPEEHHALIGQFLKIAQQNQDRYHSIFNA